LQIRTVEDQLDVFSRETIEEELAVIEREGPQHVVLTVTEACNFRCLYCAYSGAYFQSRQHSAAIMQEDVALRAIRWYMSFVRPNYHIGFYGGEPLLAFRLIKTAVNEARSCLPANAELSFGLTTNGWLLDDRTADFLSDNHFQLSPFQIRSATGQHRRHGGVSGWGKGRGQGL
jgi:uncharacterized protein